MTRDAGATTLLALLLTVGLPPAGRLTAQVPADPVLRGRVLLGDSPVGAGTVILHRVATDTQGEVDSTRVAPDGSFAIRLPAVPDPKRSEVYFASVRHAGILYFGKAITLPVQLDSLYEIQTYDTAAAPAGGASLTVLERSVFLEIGEDGRWRATDLFEIRNDGSRTLVAPEGGVVWRHPLPERASDAEVRRSDVLSGGAEIKDGELVVTAPVPPGERLFVVGYAVPDPFLVIPIPVRTEVLEVLVQEPAPDLEAAGLQRGPQVELEPGRTFRRLTGAAPAGTVVRLTEGRGPAEPPVRWTAVILAMVLTAVALWAVRWGGAQAASRAAGAPARDRRSLVLEIARLDEAFASSSSPSAEEREAYEARRRDLIRRLSTLG